MLSYSIRIHLFPHFRVRIERVTSTAALSQHLQQQVLSQQDRGAIELETLTPPGQTGTSIFTGEGKTNGGGDGQRRNPQVDSLTAFASSY